MILTGFPLRLALILEATFGFSKMSITTQESNAMFCVFIVLFVPGEYYVAGPQYAYYTYCN